MRLLFIAFFASISAQAIICKKLVPCAELATHLSGAKFLFTKVPANLSELQKEVDLDKNNAVAEFTKYVNMNGGLIRSDELEFPRRGEGITAPVLLAEEKNLAKLAHSKERVNLIYEAKSSADALVPHIRKMISKGPYDLGFNIQNFPSNVIFISDTGEVAVAMVRVLQAHDH